MNTLVPLPLFRFGGTLPPAEVLRHAIIALSRNAYPKNNALLGSPAKICKDSSKLRTKINGSGLYKDYSFNDAANNIAEFIVFYSGILQTNDPQLKYIFDKDQCQEILMAIKQDRYPRIDYDRYARLNFLMGRIDAVEEEIWQLEYQDEDRRIARQRERRKNGQSLVAPEPPEVYDVSPESDKNNPPSQGDVTIKVDETTDTETVLPTSAPEPAALTPQAVEVKEEKAAHTIIIPDIVPVPQKALAASRSLHDFRDMVIDATQAYLKSIDDHFSGLEGISDLFGDLVYHGLELREATVRQDVETIISQLGRALMLAKEAGEKTQPPAPPDQTVHDIVQQKVSAMLGSFKTTIDDALNLVEQSKPTAPPSVPLDHDQEIERLRSLIPPIDAEIERISAARHDVEEISDELKTYVIAPLEEKVRIFKMAHQTEDLKNVREALKRANKRLDSLEKKIAALLKMEHPYLTRKKSIQRRIHALEILAMQVDVDSPLRHPKIKPEPPIDVKALLDLSFDQVQPTEQTEEKYDLEALEMMKLLAHAAYSVITPQQRSSQRMSSILHHELQLIESDHDKHMFMRACHLLMIDEKQLLKGTGVVGASRMKLYRANRPMTRAQIDTIIPRSEQHRMVEILEEYTKQDKAKYKR